MFTMAKYSSLLVLGLVVSLTEFSNVLAIEPCKGDDRGDRKCNHDVTHRVCATLVDNTNGECNRLQWGPAGDFWKITNQQRWDWHELVCSDKRRDKVTPKPSGTNWCICMWATEHLIKQVGCDNVHIDCASTDVNHVLRSYQDRDINGQDLDLNAAKCCLKSKCPGYISQAVQDKLTLHCD